jgi:quercetin dioxygenase-like cupin family protein
MITRSAFLTSTSAALISAALAGLAVAGDQPIKRTELLRADLSNGSGQEAVIYIADVAPAGAGGRHTHYGDEFVYVISGSLTVTPDGKDPLTLQAGQAGHFPPDIVHAAKNGSVSEAAKVLVILAMEKGKPLAEPAK